MKAVPTVVNQLPFVLSLSKDISRRQAHFDRLSASGISFRTPPLFSASGTEHMEVWRDD